MTRSIFKYQVALQSSKFAHIHICYTTHNTDNLYEVGLNLVTYYPNENPKEACG